MKDQSQAVRELRESLVRQMAFDVFLARGTDKLVELDDLANDLVYFADSVADWLMFWDRARVERADYDALERGVKMLTDTQLRVAALEIEVKELRGRVDSL